MSTPAKSERIPISAKIVKIFRSMPMILVGGVFIFFAAKGCVITVWSPPKAPETYAIVGEDKREMTLTLFPDKRALITYGDPEERSFEAALLKFRGGEYGTHYIGPIWNVTPGGKSIFGFRWISGDEEPVHLRYEVVNKLHFGVGDSTFSAIGTEHESVFYERPSGFKFSGMWLEGVEYNPEMVDRFLKALENQ